jgi:hypothetical protein
VRIRSIKPDFYESEDVAKLDWDARLVFISLWSYVDDNGVGRDDARLIVAACFPLERDPRESVARVSRAINALESGGLVRRFEAEGRSLLLVTGFSKHQRIDKPGRPRYPLPDPNEPDKQAQNNRENGEIRESVARPSRECRESVAPVVRSKELGVRNSKSSCSTDAEPATNSEPVTSTLQAAPNLTLVAPPPPTRDPFEEFWALVPSSRKQKKAEAKQKFRRATQKEKVPAGLIIAAYKRMAEIDWNKRPPQEQNFIPMPSTWLNQARWTDRIPTEAEIAATTAPRKTPNQIETERQEAVWLSHLNQKPNHTPLAIEPYEPWPEEGELIA